jgi:MFS family permease
VPLPEDGNTGWLGVLWLLVATIPTAVGGGLISPSVNSLLTKLVERDIGGTLGVSSALVSAANAITPVLGGAIFQVLGSTAPFLAGGLVLAVLFVIALQKVPDHIATPVPAQ